MAQHTQTWWIKGKVLGQWPISFQLTQATCHDPRSYAYCCPTCGDVWARRIVNPNTAWMFWAVPCPSCPTRFPHLAPPGGIWICGDMDLLHSLPKEMLKREAELCLEFWGR